MFKFEDILGYHLGGLAFFHLGSIWSFPFTSMKRSDRTTFDHPLNLKVPVSSDEPSFSINIPLFLVLAWKLLGKSLYLSYFWDFLGFLASWYLKLSALSHHHHFIPQPVEIFCLPVSPQGLCFWFGARDHLQCWWNPLRKRYPRLASNTLPSVWENSCWL